MADLWLRDTDPDEMIGDISTAIVDELRPLFRNQTPRLVDRYTMAELLTISVPTLDRLVREKAVPSKLVGSRRLFEPATVIATSPDAVRSHSRSDPSRPRALRTNQPWMGPFPPRVLIEIGALFHLTV